MPVRMRADSGLRIVHVVFRATAAVRMFPLPKDGSAAGIASAAMRGMRTQSSECCKLIKRESGRLPSAIGWAAHRRTRRACRSPDPYPQLERRL